MILVSIRNTYIKHHIFAQDICTLSDIKKNVFRFNKSHESFENVKPEEIYFVKPTMYKQDVKLDETK